VGECAREAGISKLDKPAWIKGNRQSRIKLRVQGGNKLHRAEGKKVSQP
jgi:hypothetical protein